jgi:Tol biopolymer transport system component
VLGQVAVSPNGRFVALVAAGADGPGVLYVRARNALQVRQLAGTEGAAFPFWSPDSQYLGFFAQSKLKKIALAGGPPQVVCATLGSIGGTWNADGTIIFAAGGPLEQVKASGGAPVAVTTLPPGEEVLHLWPSFLPDGRHFLFSLRSERADENGVYVGSLDSREVKRVANADLRALYAPPAHLLFVRERALMAQAFDLSTFTVSGDPIPVAAPVGYVWTGLDAAFSVSSTGMLAYESADYPVTELAWFDRTGRRLGRVGEPGDYLLPWLSYDERQLLVERIDPNRGDHQIWKLDVARNGNASRLTLGNMSRHAPVLSSDGSKMVFTANQSGHFDFFVKDLRQPESDQPLLATPANKYPMDWSRDGRFLVYETLDARTQRDLWVLPLVGDRTPRLLLHSEFNESQGQLSPDGLWIAYISDESGRWEVYVRAFPGLGDVRLISTGGGTQPRWRRDGREIFYVAADRRLMAVSLGPGPNLEPAAPQALFRVPSLPSGVPTGLSDRMRFNVAADGQRFLINSPLDGAGPQSVIVSTDWQDLLRGSAK